MEVRVISLFRELDADHCVGQPLIYPFFYLAMAIAGDLGIAISLAAEGTLVKSKFNAQLSGYPNADEVSRMIIIASCN